MSRRRSIIVESLSKSYRIGQRPTYKNLRESLTDALKAPFRRLAAPAAPDPEGDGTFWALHDVSFEVEPGEIIGVVGRNGSGKSTLLKVLSRITEPTEGCVRIRGRVASLLEVGTGFHFELSGRENVYLNGSMLGMSKSEIDRKFDQIVAFSEVEKFLDTPIKHYSSGMYVRLAFAVAAHLETQILLVDEVLAVGDAEFQKKCLGRIEEVTREGRTVLFVSHHMPSVQNLCTRCVFLERGVLKMDGPPSEVLEAYVTSTAGRTSAEVSLEGHPGRTSDSRPVMRRVRVRGLGANPNYISMGDDLEIEVEFRSDQPLNDLSCWVFLKNHMNMNVFSAESGVSAPLPKASSAFTAGVVRCRIQRPPLMPGTYGFDLFLGSHNLNVDTVHDACRFEVHPGDVFGTGKLPHAVSGSVYWPASWDLVPEPAARWPADAGRPGPRGVPPKRPTRRR
ncbi:MAG: ABC transporter ATP-binding protein [Isosphaeraceae bacterium]